MGQHLIISNEGNREGEVQSMSKCTVLICDDNIAVHSSLTNYLNAEGMKVVSVFDGETALDQLSQQAVDMIVLDIMLPGMDGFDICKEIRRRSAVPIIMLSARSEEYDRIIGLELGADDYVVKPCFLPGRWSYESKNC